MARQYPNRGPKSPDIYAKEVQCICPKCGEEYSRKIFFTGKVPARIYCDICHQKLKRIGE